MLVFRHTLTCALIFPALPAKASIDIANYGAAENDRFSNSPVFLLNGHNLSGVGRDSAGRWVTMISDNVFLSATHYHPSTGTALTFHTSNDPLAPVVSATVAGGQQIGGTDLWIGYLDAPLVGISSYETLNAPLNSMFFNVSPYYQEDAYMIGRSPGTGGYASSPLTDLAVGTNQLEGFQENSTVDGDSSVGDVFLLIENEAGDAPFNVTSYEADLNSGDSGSPLFILEGGELVVAGIAWASGKVELGNDVTSVERDLSVYTYTGSYGDQIEAYINAHAIPEPSGLFLFAAFATWAVRRERV
ncbi:MAG: hypothetical protein ACQKBY_10395 [Verrucomicrobiales bacterium]